MDVPKWIKSDVFQYVKKIVIVGVREIKHLPENNSKFVTKYFPIKAVFCSVLWDDEYTH